MFGNLTRSLARHHGYPNRRKTMICPKCGMRYTHERCFNCEPVTRPKIKKFKSWNDLYDRCKSGDEAAQRVCIGALENLGNPTLYPGPGKLWERAYHGLQEYITALVGEYGESEEKAERDVLAEVNNVRDCCDDIKLEG